MAKKKNQSKKHKFKYADPSTPLMSAPVVGSSSAVAQSNVPAKARSAVFAGPTRDFSYVVGDLRRILVLAVVLVGVELVLWYLFSHTGIGNKVYSLVRV